MGAADGDRALAARQVSRALRRVQIEVEELLKEASVAGTGPARDVKTQAR